MFPGLNWLRNQLAKIPVAFSPGKDLRVKPLGLKGGTFNRNVALTTLIIIIAFAIGDQVGQARHKSAVDESISTILKKDPQSPKKEILQRAAIDAILKATGDQWANYYPKQSVKALTQTLSGRYSGVGIWVRKNSSGVLEVSSVTKNSPAEKVGVKVLDAVTEINGTSVVGSPIAAAIALLRGKPGTPVSLLIERNQNKLRLSVKRDEVSNGDVIATQIQPKVVYIQVSSFSTGVASQVAVALNKYEHSKGIILDLRDNPGGLINEAVDISSLFLSDGPIVSYSRQGDSDKVLKSSNKDPEIAPMAVLINRSTASSAEVVAAALQDRNRAVILGENSYGKGTVQEILTLSDGSKLEITVGKYRTPSGRIIDQIGINPDLLVSESDEISKALQVLQGLASIDSTGASPSK